MVCHCQIERHPTRRVVITGGPGAGKTALLGLALRQFCDHVTFIQEAASIIFKGGFPRRSDRATAVKATQRAIFHTQTELERLAEDADGAMTLCDRGTIDGSAYWPGPPDELFEEVGTTRAAQLARYHAVIHLRTPRAHDGYDQNTLRIENAAEAAFLDERIAAAWEGHPRRIFVESQHDFVAKVQAALAAIAAQVPDCCRLPPSTPRVIP